MKPQALPLETEREVPRAARGVRRITLALCSAMVLALAFGTGWLWIRQNPGESEALKPFSIEPVSRAIAASSADPIWQMLGQVNRDRVVTDLRRLTGEEPICTSQGCRTAANRQTGSEGLRWATDYIAEDLAGRGYSVEFRNWSREGWSDRNLIVRKVGASAPDEEVFLVAHVDGVKLSGGERFPAADDNASGAADLLEVARVLSGYSFGRTLVLFFSTGEEHGALGVKSYLDQLSAAELGRIVTAVDVDMVGYDANRDGVMELWHGDHAPSLAVTTMMSDTIGAYRLALTPRIVAGCG